MNKWPYATIVAHRGAGRLAPENTLASLLTGAFYGHTLVEFDVKLSRDNTVFLLHDDTLNRTSNGQGMASHLNYSEIIKYDAGSWLDPRFKGEYMPTLQEASACCIQHHMNANIEIKPSVGREEETGRLVALEAQKYWDLAPTSPLLSSFSLTALRAAQEVAPHLPRGMLFDRVPDHWEELAVELACLSIHVHYRYLTKTLAHQIKAAGFYLFVFTVNDLERAKMFRQWGADCICTDQIDTITNQALLTV